MLGEIQRATEGSPGTSNAARHPPNPLGASEREQTLPGADALTPSKARAAVGGSHR